MKKYVNPLNCTSCRSRQELSHFIFHAERFSIPMTTSICYLLEPNDLACLLAKIGVDAAENSRLSKVGGSLNFNSIFNFLLRIDASKARPTRARPRREMPTARRRATSFSSRTTPLWYVHFPLPDGVLVPKGGGRREVEGVERACNAGVYLWHAIGAPVDTTRRSARIIGDLEDVDVYASPLLVFPNRGKGRTRGRTADDVLATLGL